ncbi:SCO6745 family protein [Prauserella cavernicola]|uniref:SalK n=1 Tax=Prauserella cavernicola TaxID=2800127 RepID=A0A934V9M6_9PSEU|nr:hypothetical protein [Prauserella cavernicola]MBK1788998.1 hypothetical protein [Prauserella cavernicola]
MDHEEARAVAARCNRALEPLHSMVYFAPEAEQAYTELGLPGGRMGYFASRGAPLGPVGPAVVAATFYNFNPALVARHIPSAWTFASPEAIVEARFLAAGAALRRLLGPELAESEALTELAALVREAADGCDGDGRVLYAAHAALDWPEDPVLVLWHGISLLREHRGDGHIAALVGNGLGGLPALITHCATGKGFIPDVARKLRGWSEDEWAAATDELREQGQLDADGGLTELGLATRERIEEQTNAAATGPFRWVGADKAERMRELGKELTRQVLANGAFPPGVFARGK